MSKTTVTFVPSLTLTYEDHLLESVGIGGEMYVRITPLKHENAKLRELIVNIWNVARLMDANRHIDGMRITEEFRRECEKAFKELGIEAD